MSGNVEDIMSKNLKIIPGDTPMGKAAKEMKDAKVHHLIMVDEKGVIAGILSDRDTKKFMSPFAGSKDATDKDNATALIKVGQLFAGKEIITVKPDQPIKDVVEKMLQKGFHALPVVDEDNKPVGIVTSTDLLKILLNKL